MGKPDESMWPKTALGAMVLCILLWLLNKSRWSSDESTEHESVKRE